jgi:poly-gamma-glutamate synthase PgsB/CapB
MTPLLVLLILAGLWVSYLVMEATMLARHRRMVPLRIAVTGTRGKTTVTRQLAAILTEDGRNVLAKTTGSDATYVFPNGEVQEIRRLGAPSIIEQKRLLRRGARLGVDAVLAEVMSVHPEYHRVESGKILQPHLVAVTNFRVDHVEAQGATEEEVASVLALDVPPGAKAFVPDEEWSDAFAKVVGGRGGEVVRVTGEGSHSPEGFDPNQGLVWGVARSLGVSDDVIRNGLSRAQGDIGALKGWRYRPNEGADWLLVNAFAANDPESTRRIHERLTEVLDVPVEEWVGLLSLRADRGDRTLQWVDALRRGAIPVFRTLFVAGLHAAAVKHRLRGHPVGEHVRFLRPGSPEETMDRLLGSEESGRGLLFGFGNIVGLGRTLVDHWEKVGEPHGL